MTGCRSFSSPHSTCQTCLERLGKKEPSLQIIIPSQMLASHNYCWSGARLVMWPLLRIILIPLLILCTLPHQSSLLQGEFLPLILTTLLGLSNGLFGSLPIILAPGSVRDAERELVGNLMTFSYCCGLTIGSLLAYGLQGVTGYSPQIMLGKC